MPLAFAKQVVGNASLSVGGISGGQKRKLQLAIEMLAAPAMLILDEPSARKNTA